MNLAHQQSQHPNVHTAFAQWSEEQTLHVAVAYSNPLRWRTRRELMNDFRKRTEPNPNVTLYVGEIAYGDRPFEVTSPDNPRDFQFRTECEIWHKENILNLVVQRMPAEARYVAYLDGDIQMSRQDWALEAIHLLQHYQAVQLFRAFSDMGNRHEHLGVTNGFAYCYCHSILPDVYRPGKEPPRDYSGKGDLWWGATGLGWAFRRSAWDAMGGLLDICVLGSADWHMAYGMIGRGYKHNDLQVGDGYVRAIRNWQSHAASLDANIGYLDNHITHYWHGTKAKRFYRERTQILTDHRFDPHKDLKRDWQGLYQLSGNNPKLRDDVRAYFRARNEDHPGD